MTVFPGGHVYAAADAKNPGAASGTNWTTPANIADGVNATYASYNNTTQDYLKVTNFKFSISSAATINGITVTRKGHGDGVTAAKRQYAIGLTKDGAALAGTAKTGVDLPQDTDDVVSTGTTTDLWGTTWSTADINSSNFGIIFYDNDTTSDAIYFDSVTITVSYTGPSVNILEVTYDFTSFALNASSVAVSSLTVTNTGDVTETFYIRAATNTAGSPWTVSADSANGFNKLALRGGFHPSQPGDSQFGAEDVINETSQVSQTEAGGGRYTINGDETGVDVPAGAKRALWLRFTMPLETSTTDQQQVKVTVAAQQ
ncbi:MAG: hypothetical protein HY796_07205 [Elusimicrobia bacterium]|nr:hypothetical protein [Elusimicrobiota bacterium]